MSSDIVALLTSHTIISVNICREVTVPRICSCDSLSTQLNFGHRLFIVAICRLEYDYPHPSTVLPPLSHLGFSVQGPGNFRFIDYTASRERSALAPACLSRCMYSAIQLAILSKSQNYLNSGMNIGLKVRLYL
jgi:hypothetical protein